MLLPFLKSFTFSFEMRISHSILEANANEQSIMKNENNHCSSQKQPPRGVLSKRSSEKMQQVYR